MKKIMFAAAAVLTISASVYCYTQKNSTSAMTDVTMESVEAQASCESIGWSDNDGNCVTNGSAYFCKTDSWYELTDCKL